MDDDNFEMAAHLKQVSDDLSEMLKTGDDGLQKGLTDLYQRMSSLSSVDKANTERNKLVIQQVASLVPLSMAWVPVWGPFASGVLRSTIIGISGDTIKQGIASGASAALTYSLNSVVGATFGARAPGLLTPGGMLLNAGAPASANTTSNSNNAPQDNNDTYRFGQFGADAAINFTGFIGFLVKTAENKGKGGAAIQIPPTTEAYKKATGAYNDTIRDGIKWMSQIKDETVGGLTLLLFYKLIDGMKVGGKGSSFIESGKLYETFGSKSYKNIEEVKAALNTLEKASGGVGKSELVITFNKYKTQGQGQGYSLIIQGDGSENLISGICLEKARIIAYVDNYKDGLKATFGNMFLSELNSINPADKKLLPENFSTDSGHGRGQIFGDKQYPKANRYAVGMTKEGDRSTHRKDFAVGVYAFHAILLRHLGTYNLSALPPFGANPENDIAVHRALVDAIATQWWITSRAYDASNTALKKVTREVFKANILDGAKILELPYIKPYFDPERVYQYQGRLVANAAEVLEKHAQGNNGKLQNDYQDQKGKVAAVTEIKNIIDTINGVINNKNQQAANIANQIADLQRQIAQLIARGGNDQENITRLENDLKARYADSAASQLAYDNTKFLREFRSWRKQKVDQYYGGYLRFYRYDSDNNLSSVIGGIGSNFLLSLFPTGKDACELFSVLVHEELKKLYSPILGEPQFKDSEVNLIVGLNQKATEAPTNYRDFESAYTKVAGNNRLMAAADIRAGFEQSLGIPARNNNPPEIDRNKTKRELVEILANIHMGSYSSVEGNSKFNQAAFNREIAMALSRIAKLLS